MPHAGERARYGQVPMFSGDLAFLSNFDDTPFHVASLGVVATAEHAFNALKSTDPQQRAWVIGAPSASEAKKRGRRVALRPDWDFGGRVQAMQRVLVAKFAVPALNERLIATGTLHLIETNGWCDIFWGACFCPQHQAVPGVNMLGELLMALRARRAFGLTNSEETTR